MEKKSKKPIIAVIVIVALAAAAVRYGGLFKSGPEKGKTEESTAKPAAEDSATVELKDTQLPAIKIGKVERHAFPVEIEAVGSIDFDEDLSVQVFPPYQGKIIQAFAELGDVVTKGQTLFTIDSPDLVQAENTLIAAAAQKVLFDKELVRATKLYMDSTGKGVAERELEQATNDQQTAEGALRAAREAVRVFGKTEEEINRMVDLRKIDPSLVVPSPIDGQITARNAQPGLLVQPGNAPAPYSMADISTKWMLASVMESDAPQIQVGQPVEVSVLAYPGRTFTGKIVKVGASVDPLLHRVTTRSTILDPRHELLPSMICSFKIATRQPVDALAIPENGVVREGDGRLTAWVTTDHRHFLQRELKVGLRNDGRDEVLAGLKLGETVVTEGAVFLSNILYAPPSD